MTYLKAFLTSGCLITTGLVPAIASADEGLTDKANPSSAVRGSVAGGLNVSAQTGSPALNLGAQPEDDTETISPKSEWRTDFHSWMWMVGIEGDIGAGGITSDVSASFGDILDASDSVFALSGRLEVGKGKWGGFIDATYFKLGVDDVTGPGGDSNDITSELVLTDFGAMYRIGEWEASGNAAENTRSTTLDLYAGGRFTKMKVEVDPASSAKQSRDIDWIDPIVGAKITHPFSKSWHLQANADIGGFGVESDFAWSTTAVTGVDFELFEHQATAYFGYRALSWDFSDGTGNKEFTWDVVMHGPIAGFSFQF